MVDKKIVKVAIVTGASRGIGAATAILLAKNGYSVCINYLKNKQQADKVIAQIIKNGGKAIAVRADVGKEKDVIHLFRQVDKILGPVSALVNNAGIHGGIGLVEEITMKRLESVFSTNVYGTFLCSREAVKRMKNLGYGAIVNVSSQAGQFGGNTLSHYAASKAAINTFTIGFAREVAPHGIRVNAVSPGIIETEIQKLTKQKKKSSVDSIPMGRMGKPEEVAEVISWLISVNASYVSGSIIPVSGAR